MNQQSCPARLAEWAELVGDSVPEVVREQSDELSAPERSADRAELNRY